MKKFLAVLGCIFGVIIIAIVIIAAIFIPRSIKLDKEATAYIQDVVPKIVASWDPQPLIDRATPEFASSMKSSADLGRIFTMFRQLGGLKNLEKPTGNVTSGTFSQTGPITIGNYVAKAEFEKGKATILVQLKRSGDTWQINDFISTRTCFFPQRPNQTIQPTSVNTITRRAAPLRENFSVFATGPWISSRCPASLVRFASARSRTPAVMLLNATRGLSFSR